MSDNTDAYIFVGVQTTNANDVEEIEKALKTEGFPALNLSHDELAKLHLRHMVGGHSKLAVNEKLYRFEFPERPGALMKFLTSLAIAITVLTSGAFLPVSRFHRKTTNFLSSF